MKTLGRHLKSAHLAYEEFESFKCPLDMGIIDYLSEFERL